MYLYSDWYKQDEFYIKKALIAIIGIGDYNAQMPELIGIERDYKNILSTFYKQFGYSVLFYDTTNHLHYCNTKPHYDIGINNSIIKQTKLLNRLY